MNSSRVQQIADNERKLRALQSAAHTASVKTVRLPRGVQFAAKCSCGFVSIQRQYPVAVAAAVAHLEEAVLICD